ncbi:MAG: thioesterase family protein [Pseudomonadota bacterium]
MSVHKTEIRVRFGDTDMAGVVYLPRYIHYFVIAWEELFRSLGMPFEGMVKKDTSGMPPVELNCRFKAPAYCGDLLEVHTQVTRILKRGVTFKFDLYRKEDKRLLVTGTMTCMTVNEGFKSSRLPDYILEAVTKFKEGK